MAIYKFTKLMFLNKSVDLYNGGNHKRDFTHVDDGTNAVKKLIYKPSTSKIPYQIFNISSNKPINIIDLLNKIANISNKKFSYKKKQLQKGDIINTNGSIKKINSKVNYKPSILINKGLNEFVKWYKNFTNN